MEKKDRDEKREVRICIRLTQKEYARLRRLQKQTTDRMLSDFARKKLLGKPVRVLTRNHSLDLLMEELIKLRRELNYIGNNFNQVVHKINAVQQPGELTLWLPICKKQQEQLLAKTEIIRNKISKMGRQWLQDSSAENL